MLKKRMVRWLVLMMVSVALAYAPKPLMKSPAEQQLAVDLDKAATETEKLSIAKSALEANPENIPLGRAAQDVILKQMEDPIAYFKTRAEAGNSIAAHYLHARAAGDSAVMEREAKWILDRDAKNFWGQILAGLAEWEKAKPDLAVVRRHFETAIAADPSRPEGYINLGFLFEDEDKWIDARAAFEAASVADPSNTTARDARITAYAQLRDGDSFFRAIQNLYPTQPLNPDLPSANGTGRLIAADLKGQYTVIEYWAYT